MKEGITLYLTRAATHLPALNRALPFSLAAIAASTFSSSDISYVALGCTPRRPRGEGNAPDLVAPDHKAAALN